MQPAATQADVAFLKVVQLAAPYLKPAEFNVSTRHLAVRCPLCILPNSPLINPVNRIMSDYMFAVVL